MNFKKLTLAAIRRIHYKGQTIKLGSMGIQMNNFFKNPYTFLKARYYIETSAFLVYTLQFTKISPNFITKIYIILSLSVLFLLASRNA